MAGNGRSGVSRILSGLSIGLSVVALAVAIPAMWSAEARGRDGAQAAIRERERQLIERVGPPLRRLHADFGTTLSPAEQHPQTIEDLLAPLLRLPTSAAGEGGR
jgi:hypothetical protein